MSPRPRARSPLPTASRRARALRALVLAAALAASAACRQLEYYEREAFTRWTMQIAEGPCEQHFHQKIYYSEEGSAGGIGTKAGGGCGCY